MRTLTFTRSAGYSENQERTGANRGGFAPCVLCGRAINLKYPHHLIHEISGGGVALHPEDEDEYIAAHGSAGDPGDCGGQPIGPDCLKQHPELKQFTVRAGGLMR